MGIMRHTFENRNGWPPSEAAGAAVRQETEREMAMNRLLAILCACVAAASGCVAWAAEELEPGPTTPLGEASDVQLDMNARISYSIGLSTASYYKKHGVKLDPVMVMRGVEDAVSGGQPLLGAEEVSEAMKALHAQTTGGHDSRAATAAKSHTQTQRTSAGDRNEQDAAFLAANAKKEGVVVLPSGLQYKVLKPGRGATPGPTDTVTVHYRGRTIDGREFDSSYKRGEPSAFKVNGVIKGFSEALQLMKVGAKWEIYLPAELAYGQRALIFEIELLDIKAGE